MRKDKLIFTFGILTAISISVVSALLFYLDKSKLEIKKEINVNNETQKNVEITPAPEIIDFKNKEIEVLNATPTKGLAKVYADKLVVLGYLKVTTGNYTEIIEKNVLYAPSDFSDELDRIGFKDYEFIKSNSIKIIIGK